MKDEISILIEKLGLLPHPEGGYYKEVYRNQKCISRSELGEDFSGARSIATSIYYLLAYGDFSAFHRIKQDEIWNFHSGSNLYIHSLDGTGKYKKFELGMFGNGFPQYVVEAGKWFAASVKDINSYTLVGCTVAPGFDFDDFEMASREQLINLYPDNARLIKEFTRD